MISSRDSFAAFVEAAYMALNQDDAEFSTALDLNGLYNWAADYNPANCPPKNTLAGQPLYAAMSEYVDATIPHKIVMQLGWRDLTDITDTLTVYYDELAAGRAHVPIIPADQLPTTYLHVYPRLQADADWRIGLNIVPADMANAMAALAPLLDEFPDIDHMKFLGPASAGKADSVIVYLRRNAERYAGLREAVLAAAQPLTLQPRVGAIWNEIMPGIGEASEPPPGYGLSFTSYRCLVVYLAYLKYRESAAERSLADFRVYLAQAMTLFGLDPASPHLQGALAQANPNFQTWWQALLVLQEDWEG
ncbi:MAG TPA: T3SS effector HopA1 family protein [Rhizomicrobium sp.]